MGPGVSQKGGGSREEAGTHRAAAANISSLKESCRNTGRAPVAWDRNSQLCNGFGMEGEQLFDKVWGKLTECSKAWECPSLLVELAII